VTEPCKGNRRRNEEEDEENEEIAGVLAVE
jgi:hypothetical protein